MVLDLRRDPRPGVARPSTRSSPSSTAARRLRSPPSGIASRALSTRFRTACLNFSASSGTRGSGRSARRSSSLDVLLGRLGADQADDVLEDLLDVDRPEVEALEAGEVAEALEDAVEPADLGLQHADQLGDRPVGARSPRSRSSSSWTWMLSAVSGFLISWCRPDGQRAEAGELLHPPHLLLHQQPLGDVAEVDDAADGRPAMSFRTSALATSRRTRPARSRARSWSQTATFRSATRRLSSSSGTSADEMPAIGRPTQSASTPSRSIAAELMLVMTACGRS